MTVTSTESNMTDIVEQLRNYIPGENGDEVQDRISEAADEIERLRKQVEHSIPYVEAFRREEARADKLGREIDDLRASIPPQCAPELLREALKRSVIAIDDWMHVYAPDFCDPQRVREAEKRIGEYGTLSYIAHVQEQNHAALSVPRPDSDSPVSALSAPDVSTPARRPRE